MQLEGKQAPPLKLENLDGKLWDLSQSKGRWVFVHFWASWCGPCRKEMPKIQQISKELDASKMEIVLINTAESEDTVFEFIGIVAPEISPLMDKDGLVSELWQPRGLPATFFVDPQGALRYLALGGRAWDEEPYLGFVKGLYKK